MDTSVLHCLTNAISCSLLCFFCLDGQALADEVSDPDRRQSVLTANVTVLPATPPDEKRMLALQSPEEVPEVNAYGEDAAGLDVLKVRLLP